MFYLLQATKTLLFLSLSLTCWAWTLEEAETLGVDHKKTARTTKDGYVASGRLYSGKCGARSGEIGCRASGRLQGQTDAARPSRSDDGDPYHVLVDQLSQQVSQLTAQVHALTTKLDQKSAFAAHFGLTELTGVGVGQTLVYDVADINVGNSYDTRTGIFRAPFAGVYVFNIKLLSTINHWMRLDIVTGGRSVATTEVWADPDREVATAQGVVHLTAGQSVWVVAGHSTDVEGRMHGGPYSTFSGFLLYSD